ncbi:MAG: ABC transporter permease [bacterium]
MSIAMKEPSARAFSVWRSLAALGPFFGLILVLAVFTAINGPAFLSLPNLQTMVADASIVAIAALGMTLVIIGGGIDLSTGSLVALSSIMCAKALAWGGFADSPALSTWGWTLAFLAGIGTGMFCGAINGSAIVGLRVVPFIATLGMLSVARGGAKWQSHNQPINVTYAFGDWVQPYVKPAWIMLAPSVWLAIVLAVIMGLVLNRTVFGRSIVALGSSEATARLCGLRIGWLKITLYTIAGAFAGLAGVVQTARLTRGDPSVAVGMELNVIAAVVIGGGSLSGGEGSILGTMAGALIMSALATGATQAGWENYVQEILVGLIIVFAVALDQLRARKMQC